MLKATGLAKRYGEVNALEDLDLEVERGQILALLGPNGAGKSTATRILVGLSQADRGHLEYNGHGTDARERPPSWGWTPGEVGYLPEERGLYGDQPALRSLVYLSTLRGLSPPEAEQRARRWLEQVGLEDRGDEKVSTLSKGNQQRVQLGAALLHAPDIAFLDEPFSGLDPVWQERLLEILVEAARSGTAIVLSAHQMDLVERVADSIIILSAGRTLLSGSMEQLRRDHGRARVKLSYRQAPDLPPDAFAGRHYQAIDRQTLAVDAPEGADLSELLARAASFGELIDAHREVMGLHQLYVDQVRAAEKKHAPALEQQENSE